MKRLNGDVGTTRWGARAFRSSRIAWQDDEAKHGMVDPATRAVCGLPSCIAAKADLTESLGILISGQVAEQPPPNRLSLRACIKHSIVNHPCLAGCREVRGPQE